MWDDTCVRLEFKHIYVAGVEQALAEASAAMFLDLLCTTACS